MGSAAKKKDAAIDLPARRKAYEDDDEGPDIKPSIAVSQPLLSDSMADSDTDSQPQTMWERLATRRPWKKTRRRAPSASGREFDVENIVCGKRNRTRKCTKVAIGILVALGIFQLIMLIGNLIVLLVPDGIHSILHSWGKPGHIGFGLSHWPTDFTRDILPKPIHSHNDYWRRVPFFDAIGAGAVGVEADIWLFAEELYVGHSISSLTPNRTLDSLYINPLLDVLNKQNPDPKVMPETGHQIKGVYDTTPEQPLIFLIDFKTAGSALFPYVVKALEPLRSKGYLSYQDGSQFVQGPVIVVGTGNTPFDMIISDEANPHHDIFFDAPLDQMYEPSTADEDLYQSPPPASNTSYTYNASNSLYASVSFKDTVGHLKGGTFSDDQLQRARGFIKGAHLRGLKARFWDLPYWPISLRNRVWTVLVKEGMDILNVDDLKGATEQDWEKRRGWFKT